MSGVQQDQQQSHYIQTSTPHDIICGEEEVITERPGNINHQELLKKPKSSTMMHAKKSENMSIAEVSVASSSVALKDTLLSTTLDNRTLISTSSSILNTDSKKENASYRQKRPFSHIVSSRGTQNVHASQATEKKSAFLLKTTSSSESQACSEGIKKLDDPLDSLNKNITIICESHDFMVYCVSDFKSKAAVKVFKNGEEKEKQETERLKKEFEITQKLSHPSIRKAIRLGKFQSKQAIGLEWIDGQTVTECGKFDVKTFLKVAIEMLHAVVAMHNDGVIHKNLTAEHIIVNYDPLRVYIIGFGSSTEFEESMQMIDQPGGDLSYMSPEKTGKVNRAVDYRTDFYSLGVIFFRMLAGKLPFISNDRMTLTYMHMFEPTPALDAIDCTIPRPISDMVSKLMEKDAKERYQSARGILYDLQLMLSEYETDTQLMSIIIAEHDFAGKLLLPQKLYGRSSEFSILLSAFERAAAGSVEVVFLSGKAGTGKTSLVLELRKYIAQKKGYMITGKYDQTQEMVPFSALCEGFRHFFDMILMGSKENLMHYTSLIRKAVGDEGKVLTDFIGNLYLIIGKQPNLAVALGDNAKNRLYFVFCNLVRSICMKEHPIVIFLDDLQWADLDSLRLLGVLLTQKSMKHLLFVGTYRDEKVTETHPLTEAMQKLKEANIVINQIEVSNLSNEDVNKLIADTLQVSQSDVFSLTALVHEKTQGNAFFVNQFLVSLVNENVLHFSYEEHKWKWELDKFGSKLISSNAVELVITRIQKLKDAEKEMLKVAGCIGNPFKLSTLILVTEDSISAKQVISDGWILPIDTGNTWHRFAHDHIREAIFSLTVDDERENMSYRIGKLMLEKCLTEENDENVFVMVNLLNSAVKVIKDDEELDRIARLNLRAGMKALSSTAFELALQYFGAGARLLQEDCWEKDYDFSLKLYNAAAEAAFCAGDQDSLCRITENVLQKATDFLHKIDCYSIQMRELNKLRKHSEALHIGLYVLEQLGENIPVQPTESFIFEELQKTSLMIKNKTVEEIAKNVMQGKSDLYKMEILSNIEVGCVYSHPVLLPILASRSIQLTLMYGVSKFSSLGFAILAVAMCAKLGRFEEACQIGQLSLMLLEKCPAKEMISRTLVAYYGGTHHWCHSIHECLEPMMEGFRVALETGANDVAFFCAGTACLYSFFAGKQLEILLEEMQPLTAKLKTSAFLSVYRAVKNFLTSSEENAAFLIGVDFDYRRCKEESISPSDYARGLILCTLMAFLFYEYDLAFEFAEACRPLTKLFTGEYNYTIFTFYDGLVALALVKCGKEGSEWEKVVHESISKLKKWSETSVNQKNQLALLEAEMAALNNEESKAMKLYDDAIELSKSNEFIHEEALAYERAGIFYLEMNSTDKASHYLSRSHLAYMEWGAKAKVSHLEKLYSDFITEEEMRDKPSQLLNAPIYAQSSSVSIVSALSCISEKSFSPNKKRERTF